MELKFKQVAIAENGNTVLGLTEDGNLYYKLGTAKGKSGWRPITMTEADEKTEKHDGQKVWLSADQM